MKLFISYFIFGDVYYLNFKNWSKATATQDVTDHLSTSGFCFCYAALNSVLLENFFLINEENLKKVAEF